MGVVIVRILVFATLSSLILGCTGPEKNKIIGILRDVDWKELADQLNLNCAASIHGACQNELDPNACKLRGVLTRLIDSRDLTKCCNIAEEVASALRSLASPRNRDASELVKEMCSPSEIVASNPDERRNGEPINFESTPESNQLIILLALPSVIALGILTALIFKVRRRRRETSQQHPIVSEPPPNTFVSGSWTMLLLRNKILVIVVVILLMLCSFVFLYYYWNVVLLLLFAVLLWFLVYIVRMMFYMIEIRKIVSHLMDTKKACTVTRRRRRETSQQYLVSEPPKPPPIIVLVILLMLCSYLLLFYHWVTETVIIWVIMFVVWIMFYMKEIPKRDFHLDKKKGVLILVTSTYNGTLPLTEMDRNEMITTFTKLDYYIAELHDSDANRSNVLILLQQLSDYLSRYSGPLSEQALVFGFSGHGGRKDTLVTNDRQRLSLMEDILPHFVGNPQLYYIKKLFFIDACRGHSHLKEITEDVPRSSEKTMRTLNYEEGNYLIAYATVSDHELHDGYWMHKLARSIRENFQKPLTSILNDLAGELPIHQQPKITGRLRGDFAFK